MCPANKITDNRGYNKKDNEIYEFVKLKMANINTGLVCQFPFHIKMRGYDYAYNCCD
jgi:hypothetical protein